MDIFNKIKGHKNDKLMLVGLITLVLISFVFLSHAFSKEIIIKDLGAEISIKTMPFTVEDVMKRADVILSENDIVNYKPDDAIKDGMVIEITRSATVRIIDNDEEYIVDSADSNVASIIEKGNITIGTNDIVVPSLSEDISESKTIEITRVTENVIKEEQVIPFNTIVTYNDDLGYDEYKVVNEGSNGLREISYKITYENGKEVMREVTDQKVLKAPVNKRIEKAEEKYLVSSRGQVIRYKSVLIMEATAYDLSVGSTGKTPDHPEYGITFSGTRARPGVVAVDPRVIPLGTKLYVESLDSTKDYGVASAEDTGSAIKGKKIDLFMEDSKAAWRFGRRKVKVYILDKNYK